MQTITKKLYSASFHQTLLSPVRKWPGLWVRAILRSLSIQILHKSQIGYLQSLTEFWGATLWTGW